MEVKINYKKYKFSNYFNLHSNLIFDKKTEIKDIILT